MRALALVVSGLGILSGAMAWAGPTSEPVTVYLRNGITIQGVVIGVDDRAVHLRLADGAPLAVPRSAYTGLVRQRKDEQALAESLSTQPPFYQAATAYVRKVRPQVEKVFAQGHPVCEAANRPLAVVRILPSGQAQSVDLLAQSGCPALDAAYLDTLRRFPYPPLPAVIQPGPLAMHFIPRPGLVAVRRPGAPRPDRSPSPPPG